MDSLIKNLRQKPDHHKKSIAFAASLFFTAIVFMIWFSIVRVSYTEGNSGFASNDNPLTVIKNSVANTYTSIQNDLGKFQYRAGK